MHTVSSSGNDQSKNRMQKTTTTIAQAKLTHWNDFVGNLDDRVDLDNVYKEIKKIKQQYCPPDFDLRVGDRVFQTSQAKAEAFPEVLADASSTHQLPAVSRLL